MNKVINLTQCTRKECALDSFGGTDKCVLHGEKRTDDLFSITPAFYQAFIQHLEEKSSSKGITNFAKNGVLTSAIKRELQDSSVTLSHIIFPRNDEGRKVECLKLLRLFKSVHFNYCTFESSSVFLPNVELFYQDCKFNSRFLIHKSKLLANTNHVLFQECKFHGDVSFISEDDNEELIDVSLFRDCVFESKLEFQNFNFLALIFKNSSCFKQNISTLLIDNCEIEKKFSLNLLTSKNVRLINTDFKSKFELKGGEVDDLEINDSNFHGIFDAYDSYLVSFECYKCIFKEFSGFENTRFGKDPDDKTRSDEANISKFEYVTFLNFTNFRRTSFFSGLDLENTNLKESPNFLNVSLYGDNTNRETLRIIKDSFDKIGNHIEANKFFVFEMKQYKKELKGFSPENIIFWLNEKTSNFGQSYILPIFWILVFALIHYLLILGHESDLLYRLYPPVNNQVDKLSNIINGVFSSIIPLKRFLREGMECLGVVFYIIFATLIWQTIVALKRHTKR